MAVLEAQWGEWVLALEKGWVKEATVLVAESGWVMVESAWAAAKDAEGSAVVVKDLPR